MQFKDAAYEILKIAGEALHYNQITEMVLERGFIVTMGKTPSRTMGAALYTDTLKPDSRFKRGEKKGTFQVNDVHLSEIQQKVEDIKTKVGRDLLRLLHQITPDKFEELILSLLVEMGFEETERTAFANDQGVDVRGVLRTNTISSIRVAIQAKRWTSNVGAPVVRNLRGSLNSADGEQGIIITPSDFTSGAITESQITGRVPISLINGKKLIGLLIEYRVGVALENYVVPSIDKDYWIEFLDLDEGLGLWG